jgi:uncharacterized protein (DUF3820 family)
MSIYTNIAARSEADELLDLMVSTGAAIRSEHGDHAAQRYFDCIRRFFEAVPEHESVSDKMTDEESRAFGKKELDFGKHKGTRIDEVPMEYLYWLDAQPDFRGELRKYLKSDRIQSEGG